ncbi:MAG: 5-formyltetrahydrofolate cyclo-ligase [Sandaracinaceae bacterium]|nr:5-formyltetrahydrofolate cyclo-ligase [Sandaracinaceae bacterium]
MAEPSPLENDLFFRIQVKAALRERIRSLRRALPALARLERSQRIASRLFNHPAWERANSVLLYASMPTEVNTQPIEQKARQMKKRIACPRITENHLDVRLWEEGVTPFPQGHLAPEPPPDAPPFPLSEIELVVVPAIALDPRGARIGYGRGYYDRLLPLLPKAHFIGIIFDFQLVSEVPETPYDVRVHTVITDCRTIEASPSPLLPNLEKNLD